MTSKNTMGGERPRNAADAYYTPDALALAITDALRDRLGLVPDYVVEPSAGGGAFLRAIHSTWPAASIEAVEPTTPQTGPLTVGALPRGILHSTTWEDFPCVVPPDLIVGNPPYNLPGDGRGDNPTTAERHVMLAMERLPEGGHLAFLLRLAFLSGGGRIRRLYSQHPLRALWPVTPRPSFTGGGTDGSEYGVFVWRKGWQGECDVRPLEWTALTRERRAA